MTRRIVVAAWVGSTNLGDELVFAGLNHRLRARGAVVTAISVRPRSTEASHGVAAVHHLDAMAVRRAIDGADALVFGGGGLVQDRTSPFNLPYHGARLWLARRRGVPAVAVGLGAGPLTTSSGRSIARRALRTVRAASVRDDDSAGVLDALGLPRPVVAADLALALPPPSPAPPRDRLVASLRPWTGRRSRLPVAARRAAATPEWFLAGAARALDEAAARTGLRVHLVALQGDRDHVVHTAVADRMRAEVTTTVPGVDNVVEEVAGGRAVVAMRYHAGIAALLGGRPAVLIGYSQKVTSLARDTGRGFTTCAWAPGPDGLASLASSLDDVVGRADDVLAARDRLRAREQRNDDVLDAVV